MILVSPPFSHPFSDEVMHRDNAHPSFNIDQERHNDGNLRLNTIFSHCMIGEDEIRTLYSNFPNATTFRFSYCDFQSFDIQWFFVILHDPQVKIILEHCSFSGHFLNVDVIRTMIRTILDDEATDFIQNVLIVNNETY